MLVWTIMTVIGIHLLWMCGSVAFDWLFMLGATFCLSAVFLPLLPVTAETVGLISYSQQYILSLMTLITVLRIRMRLLRGTCGAMLVFCALLLISTQYSTEPFGAFKSRVQTIMTLVSGMGMAMAAVDMHHLRRNLRLLLGVAFITAIAYSQNLSNLGVNDRLEVGGENSNGIAIVVAVLLLPAVYLAAWETSWWIRPAAGVCALWLVLPLLYSGSRTSVAAAGMAVIALLTPLLKRPLVALVILGGLALGGWWMLHGVEIGAASRLTDFSSMSGREVIWNRALAEREQAGPLFGWLFGAGSLLTRVGGNALIVRNCHSMYVQILAEMGMVGAAAFVLFTLYTLWRCLKVLLKVSAPEKWLAFALLILPLAIGVAESAPLGSRTLIGLCWGLGLGLLDRLHYADGEPDLALTPQPAWRYSEPAMA